MAELENIIESVMSSPESMGKIMDIVKMFSDAPEETPQENGEAVPSLAGLGGQVDGIDSGMLSKVIELLGDYNAGDDRRIRLLSAMRPYIKPEDGFHVDRAIHIVKLSRVAKGVLRDFLK